MNLLSGFVVGLTVFAASVGANTVSSPTMPINAINLQLEASSMISSIIDRWGRTDELKAILNGLSKCESGQNPRAINPTDGGSGSYGLYQWKVDSFYRYNKKFEIVPNLEKNEVMNIIYDPVVQTRLTVAVIKSGGIGNWRNCGIQLKLI